MNPEIKSAESEIDGPIFFPIPKVSRKNFNARPTAELRKFLIDRFGLRKSDVQFFPIFEHGISSGFFLTSELEGHRIGFMSDRAEPVFENKSLGRRFRVMLQEKVAKEPGAQYREWWAFHQELTKPLESKTT